MRRDLTAAWALAATEQGKPLNPRPRQKESLPAPCPERQLPQPREPSQHRRGENKAAGLVATACSAPTCVGGEGRGPGDPILGLEESELPRHFACKDTGRLRPMKMRKVNPEPKLVECTVGNKDKSPATH